MLGYAHCDINGENFIFHINDPRPRLRLIDMDFLCSIGSSPKARIIGSPDHIAPEIFNNELILARSDNYSLGVMLKKALNGAGRSISEESRIRLNGLVESLTASDAMHRPRVLIDALLKHQLIDQSKLAEFQRELVALVLINRYREAGARQMREPGIRKTLWDSCKLLGLMPELTDRLQGVYNVSKKGFLKLLTRVIRESQIERLGEYWHISPSNELLIELYNACAEISDGRPVIPSAESISTPAMAREIIRNARGFYERDELQVFFLINQAVAAACRQRTDLLSYSEFETLLQESAAAAVQMTQNHESIRLLEEVVASQQRRGELNPEVVFWLARRSHGEAPMERIKQIIAVGIEAATRTGQSDWALMLKCIQASALCLNGRLDDADALMKSVSQEAESIGSPKLNALVSHVHGYAAYLRGRYADAERFYRTSFETAEAGNLASEALRAVMGISWTLRARYRLTDAIKMGKVALGMDSINKEDRWRVRELSGNLATSFIRLADYRKAEYWLNKWWSNDAPGLNRATFSKLYHTLMFMETTRGNLDQAKEAAALTLEFVGNGLSALDEGKTYTSLAEIAFFQGDAMHLQEYLEKSRQIFRQMNNLGSIEELELIRALNVRYNTHATSPDLFPIVKNLVKYGSLWDAGYGLFYLILDNQGQHAKRVIDEQQEIRELLDRGEMPVFSAVKVLLPLLESETPVESVLGALKSAYRIMSDAGQLFSASVVCRRIADEYQKTGREKLSLKFLQQARRHAHQLKNESMSSRYQAAIMEIQGRNSDRSRMVSSLHSISQILRHIDDYSRSLEQIVRFAVEQTGAERGVLLEKRRQSEELRVKAYVNCDDDSLRDITDISMRVPQQVAHQAAPLILDNAVTDKRTKDYRSIILHNILSVICIPIEQDGNILGVLYLDHHTIPALFDEDDIVYIKSIANFIAVMLSAIGSYRDIGVMNKQLVEEINGRIGARRFVTEDPGLQRLFAKLPEIAPLSMPVLIYGESGTGKEIVCELLHKLSPRKQKPLIKMNCAALPESMIESELFGIAPNSATGVAAREGKFSAADGGTLFLDEIGDMPLTAQAKILRAVEYQEFERVGSNKLLKTDIRFIYATNKDLAKMVAQGTFRSDLYHRISGYTFEIAPLRERPGDILPLVEHFVGLFSKGHRPPVFSHEARRALLSYEWPGNVRELRNVIERFCMLQGGETIESHHLPDPIRTSASNPNQHKKVQEQSEKVMISESLAKCDWNVKRTAESLNLPYSTLQNKIKKFNLKRPSDPSRISGSPHK